MPLPDLPIAVDPDARQVDGADYRERSQTHRGSEPRSRDIDPPSGHMYQEAETPQEETP